MLRDIQIGLCTRMAHYKGELPEFIRKLDMSKRNVGSQGLDVYEWYPRVQ